MNRRNAVTAKTTCSIDPGGLSRAHKCTTTEKNLDTAADDLQRWMGCPLEIEWAATNSKGVTEGRATPSLGHEVDGPDHYSM